MTHKEKCNRLRHTAKRLGLAASVLIEEVNQFMLDLNEYEEYGGDDEGRIKRKTDDS